MINSKKRDGITYRDYVQVDNSPLVLSDYRDGTGIGPDPLVDTANVANRAFTTSAAVAPHSDPLRGIVHLAATRPAYAADLFDAANRENPPRTILLQVSTTEAVGDNHDSDGNIVWLSMKDGGCYRSTSDWLAEFFGLDFETAAKIASQSDRKDLPDDIQQRYAHLLDITHPGDPTAELAFRLLCEARVACGVDDEKDINGLKVYAPKGLEAWLSPFSPRGKDDKERIAAVVATMTSPASKNAAQAVFYALGKHENALREGKEFPGVREFAPSTNSSQEGGEA